MAGGDSEDEASPIKLVVMVGFHHRSDERRGAGAAGAVGPRARARARARPLYVCAHTHTACARAQQGAPGGVGLPDAWRGGAGLPPPGHAVPARRRAQRQRAGPCLFQH
jgi:hypothetical protein